MRVVTDHPVEAWANGRRMPNPERAAEEFEAFLLAQILKQGFDGPRFSNLLGNGAAESTVRSMWLDEVVRHAVATRGLGLAERIEPVEQVEQVKQVKQVERAQPGDSV